MGTVAGLNALVTGGASGIGLATATLLREEGARVATLDIVPVGPPEFRYVRADLAVDAEVRAAVEMVVREFGGLDVLVNNAGVGAQGGVEGNADTSGTECLM